MGLYPKPTDPLSLGLPVGPNSNVFYLDGANGSDSNTGLHPTKPLLTLEAAYALCTAGQNDTVAIIGGATGLYPATAIDWAKSYTHLVGLSAPLSVGQRARIVNHSDNDLAVLFTIGAQGCIFKNLQFFDGKDNAADGACVHIDGDANRTYMENCFIAGMGNGTASGPFSRAGSYSLQVAASECCLVNCTIGLDTIKRTAANAELIVTGGRNRFVHCDIRSWSETAGKFLVKIDNAGGDMRDTIFDDCLFYNFTENWANGIDDAFDMPAAGATHYVILRGNCQLVGVNSGWADTVTRIYGAGPVPNAGYGISINPTT